MLNFELCISLSYSYESILTLILYISVLALALITPQFAPNLFDLVSMLKADRVILLDVEKWSRKGRTHRIEVRAEVGTQWLNLPILSEDRKSATKDVRLETSQRWFKPFWNTLAYNYNNATYFDYYADELRHDIEMVYEFEKLLDFNLYFFKRILTYLEIDIQFELASNVEGYSTHPDECLKNLGFETLYLEHQSKNYQRQSTKAEQAVKEYPLYRQAFPGFEPNCSVLDLLLNVGVESFRVINPLIGK